MVLACQAVNDIDTSALETLEALNRQLAENQIQLHLAEVKGPVSDRLRETDFPDQLTGRFFLSTYDAWHCLHDGAAANGTLPRRSSSGT